MRPQYHDTFFEKIQSYKYTNEIVVITKLTAETYTTAHVSSAGKAIPGTSAHNIHFT